MKKFEICKVKINSLKHIKYGFDHDIINKYLL